MSDQIRKAVVGALILCAAVGIGVLAWAPSALAAGRFGPGEPPAFGKGGSGLAEFANPISIAVQQPTGDVLVLDAGNKRVQIFGPSGEYLTEIEGGEVPGGFSEVVGVAVDNSGGASAGDIYVVDAASQVVDKFRPRGSSPGEGYEYICQMTGAGGGCNAGTVELVEPTSVAVDAHGNVYVSQYGGPVQEFGPEGEYVATLGPTIFFATDIAVNAAGSALYVSNFFAFGELFKLDINPVSHEAIGGTIKLASSGVLGIAVDEATGELLVDHGAAGVAEFDEEATSQEGEVPLEEFGGSGEIGERSHGIAYSSHDNGEVYVTDSTNNDVHIFTPELAGLRPELVCTAPEEVRAKTANLACAIEPRGEATTWVFEYREAKVATWTRTTGGEVSGATALHEEIGGLRPETAYVYRAVATNGHGEMTSGPVRFTTLATVPGITKCDLSEFTAEGGVLEATLEPYERTEYYFEYGLSSPYSSRTTTGVIGSSGTPITVSERALGMEPNTEYSCRLSASDAEGSSNGPSGVFTTPLVAPTVEDRAPTASSVTRRTAILGGTVNPEKSPTAYHFVYVDRAHYEPAAKDPYHAGSSTPEEHLPGIFKDEAAVAPRVEGLLAGTTYDYAIVANNEADEGRPVVGRNYEFTTAMGTPPEVGSGRTSSVTSTTAVVSDEVNPQGLHTSYEVDLGIEVDGVVVYTRVGGGQVPPGFELVTMQFDGLAPGTTYFYRILASNEDSTTPTEGPVQAFTTLVGSSPIVQPGAIQLLAIPRISFPTSRGGTVKPPVTHHHGRRRKKRGSKAKAKRKPKRRAKK